MTANGVRFSQASLSATVYNFPLSGQASVLGAPSATLTAPSPAPGTNGEISLAKRLGLPEFNEPAALGKIVRNMANDAPALTRYKTIKTAKNVFFGIYFLYQEKVLTSTKVI